MWKYRDEFRMERGVSTMKNCRIFSGLSEQQIKLAEQLLDGSSHSYRTGELIIVENAIVEQIGIILKGQASIAKFTFDGKELLMQKLVPYDLVGAEIACTRRKTAPYTVYSASDTDITGFPPTKFYGRVILITQSGNCYCAISCIILPMKICASTIKSKQYPSRVYVSA